MDERERKKAVELIREMRQENEADGNQGIEKRLSWMYKGPNDLVDREEYLLGKAIDKSFEICKIGENTDTISRTYEPSNVPRRLLSQPFNNEQVDIANKLLDPLYAIKQKELEARRKLLDNPVKLKQIQKMLMERNIQKLKRREQKRKKRKHEKKDKKNLDKLILKKLKRLNESSRKNLIEQFAECSETSSVSEEDKKKLRRKSKKRNSMKKNYEERECSNESSSNEYTKRKLEQKIVKQIHKQITVKDSKNRFKKNINIKNSCKENGIEVEREKNWKVSKNKRERNCRSWSKSSVTSSSSSSSSSSRSNSSSSSGDNNSSSSSSSSNSSNDDGDSNSGSCRTTTSNTSRISHNGNSRFCKSHINTSSSNGKSSNENCTAGNTKRKGSKPKKQSIHDFYRRHSKKKSPPMKIEESVVAKEKINGSNYGTRHERSEEKENKSVKRSRSEFESSSRNIGRIKPSDVYSDKKARYEDKSASDSRKRSLRCEEYGRHCSSPSKHYSKEEREAKIREMMDNARMRKDDREKNLANHRKTQSEEEKLKDYDDEFMTRQMSHATSQGTMADRIRSNVNNIQRSKADMDKNFMRK